MSVKSIERPLKAFFTKRKIKEIVITAFCLIIGMTVFMGVISFYVINRLNHVNVLNRNSYEVLLDMQRVQEAIRTAEETISDYFSGNGWKTYAEASHGAEAFYKIENGELKADIISPGLVNWSIQLYQGSIVLNKDMKYRLSFNARTSEDRNIEVLLENSIDYYKHFDRIFFISKDMKKYSVDFTMPNGRDELTRIIFTFGYISPYSPETKHQVYIDNVSLIELDTGMELINNGDFRTGDVQNALPQAQIEFTRAIGNAEKLTPDNAVQRASLEKLAVVLQVWLGDKEKMIKELSSKLELSGALNADAELQTLESNIRSRLEVERAIDKIKQLELAQLDGRKKEAQTIEKTVYYTLGAVILLLILLSAGIYAFFSKAIIRPIVLTSTILKDMAEGDVTGGRNLKMNDELTDSAVFKIRQLYHHMQKYLNLLNNEIQIDGLTGIANRKTFEIAIREWVGIKKRFSLVLVDIDHFKVINDTYGHPAGDDVTRHVATLLSGFAGKDDLCFRYGGDEFGLLAGSGDIDAVFNTAEKLRKKVEETPNPTGGTVTVSLGISIYREEDQVPDRVIERADNALYKSKSGGRNRTTVL